MDILSIIEKKKQNLVLNEEEIYFFVNEYAVRKTIQDYQAAALLMAISLNGLNDEETFFLTDAMLKSGKTISLKGCPGIKIDKHSTGGVGDKVSLILAPICVALGLKVAKLSGKGLGHTGGTIDKLESVGIEYDINENQYISLLKKTGMFIVSQSEDIVPADKYIYNLRNATDTVQSFPLIAASIVSKKMALKTDYVFLDVKVGDGGFCETIKDATKLAALMLKLFRRYKRKAVIHITNMTQPLGRAVGNAIEVKTSIDFLKGNPECNEIKDLIYHFVSDICLTTGKAKDQKTAYQLIDAVIQNGKALQIFYDWAKAQGANTQHLKNDKYFNPTYKHMVKAPKSGYVNYLSTKTIGLTSFYLGAGRVRKEDAIDFHAGIYLNKIRNEYVKQGEPVGTLYSSKPIKNPSIMHFTKNLQINNKPIKMEPMVERVMK